MCHQQIVTLKIVEMGSLVTSKTIARSERPFPTEKKIDSYMINHNHQHDFKFMVVNKPTTNKETICRGMHQQSSIQSASNNSTTRTTTTHVAIDVLQIQKMLDI